MEIFIQLIIYIIRWQLSTLILAPVIEFGRKQKWSSTTCAIIANLIGAIVFYPVDKYITFGMSCWLGNFIKIKL